MIESTKKTEPQITLPQRAGLECSYYEAVELSERGFTVVPMKPFSKQPAIAWKELQSRRNTEQELSEWFGPKAPERYGIGVICKDYIVVDIDSAEALAWFQETNPDAVTPMVTVTGSGGRHLYFKRPEGMEDVGNRQRLWNKEIDLRADSKGIAIVPPSINSSGNVYRWETPISEIDRQSIPEFCSSWLPKRKEKQLIVPKASFNGPDEERSLNRVRAYLRKIESIQGAGGSSACWRVACILVERVGFLSRDQLLDEMRMWNEEGSQAGTIQPKWTGTELAHKLDDAIRKHSG